MLRLLTVLGVIAIVLAGLLFVPVELPHAVDLPGKVLPVREWTVVREAGGTIGTLLRDHRDGRVESYAVNQFDRGDAMRFAPAASVRPRRAVLTGDTVGTVFSAYVAREVVEMAGALSVAEAQEALYEAGEKAAIVEAAQARLVRAQEQVRQHAKVVDRLRSLESRTLVSEQELELAESQQRLYEADVALAEAELAAARTGAKRTQIDLSRRETAALADEARAVADRRDALTLVSPLDGVLTRPVGPDTLLAVQDTTAFVVVLPVPWEARACAVPGQTVRLRVPGLAEAPTARLVQTDGRVHRLGETQVLFATALLEAPSPALVPGVIVPCTLSCGAMTPLAHARRLLRTSAR